jgi:hypothetical protein
MSLIIGTKIVSDSIGFHLDFANRKCFAPNILNYSHWTVSSGGVAADATKYGVTFYGDSSMTGENSRVLGTDPFGYPQALVWRAQNTDPNPGNSDGGWDTGNFAIDNSKMYRFSVWTKRNTMTSGGLNLESGSFYLGYYSKDSTQSFTFSITKSNGVPFSNPYFHVTPNPNPSTFSSIQAPFLGGLDVWTLVVGHVWPLGTSTGVTLPGTNINGLVSNTNHPDSGVWTRSSGKIGNLHMVGTGYGDGVWYPSSVFSSHRAYLFYGADLTSVQSFIYPRVDIVDGLEPSVEELLTGPEPVRDLASSQNTLYPVSMTDFDMEGRGLNFYGDPRFAIMGNIGTTFSVLSVSCWVRPNTLITSDTSTLTVIQFGSNNSQTSTDGKVSIEIGGNTSAGAFTVFYRDTTTIRRFYSTNLFVLPANKWTNLCAVWNNVSTVYDLYVDGIKINQFLLEQGVSIQRRSKMICDFVSVGTRYESSAYSFNFAGKIGSTLVYNRSLTPSEVLDNFNSLKQKYGLI